jgi:pimeloyl-ACP methyl ester carboxylesterase
MNTARAGAEEARRRLLAGTMAIEQRIDLAGVATAVLGAGEGPPLILLHGGIECGGAYWAPVIAQLARKRRLIVPDMPGLGESAPFPRLSVESFEAWFAALLKQTSDEPPTLVAHSMLGSLAARFAIHNARELRRLVLYGAPAVGPYSLPPGLLLTAIMFDIAPSRRSIGRFQRWAFRDPDTLRAQDPSWFDAFTSYLLSRAALPHVKETMRRLISIGKRPVAARDLRRISVATSLLWGRHDRMVPLRIGEAAQAACGWPLHVIDDAGHAPHIERPEAFLDALWRAIEHPGAERAA